MNPEKPKIFLSYAREDMGMAKKIYNDLKHYGIDIWFDNESLLPGQDWNFEIEKAIETSKYFLVLLSSKGMSERGYVHKEIRLALNIFDRCPEDDIFMIPIRLDDCQPAHRRIKKINWINLFPETEYQNGLKKILQVVRPRTQLLRHEPAELSQSDVSNMVLRYNFYEDVINPQGKGFPHRYKELFFNGAKAVFDDITMLAWQQSGSNLKMNYKDAKKYIEELNKRSFAGFLNWQLPTLEEAMSLNEPETTISVFINSIFDSKQDWIGNSDHIKGEYTVWAVYFNSGCCGGYSINDNFVRAVRSVQSYSE